ncbi:MAG: hypothetical protein ACRDGP_04870, partial [Actinomycetota bacterium]
SASVGPPSPRRPEPSRRTRPQTYNRRTNAPSSDEVARAVKAAVLGILLGLVMAALTGDRRSRR